MLRGATMVRDATGWNSELRLTLRTAFHSIKNCWSELSRMRAIAIIVRAIAVYYFFFDSSTSDQRLNEGVESGTYIYIF